MARKYMSYFSNRKPKPEHRAEKNYSFLSKKLAIDSRFFWKRSSSKRKSNPMKTDMETWTQVVSAYPILCEDLRMMPPKCDDNQFEVITRMIVDRNLSYSVTSCVMSTILNQIQSEMANRWKNFSCVDDPKKVKEITESELFARDLAGFLRFSNAMDELFSLVYPKMFYIGRLQCLHENERANITKHFLLRLCRMIYENIPTDYITNVQQFYRTGLRAITQSHVNSVASTVKPWKCDICLLDIYECVCNDLIRIFCRTNWQLNTLDIMEWISCDAIIEVIKTKMEMVVKKMDIDYEVHQLHHLEKWLNTTLHTWLKITLEPNYCATPILTNSQFPVVMKKLRAHLYKLFINTRLSQLYDFAAIYPRSIPVVEDLAIAYANAALSGPDLSILLLSIKCSKSFNSLRKMRRNFVLTMYTTTKNILKTIDPSGLIFAEFCKFFQY